MSVDGMTRAVEATFVSIEAMALTVDPPDDSVEAMIRVVDGQFVTVDPTTRAVDPPSRRNDALTQKTSVMWSTPPSKLRATIASTCRLTSAIDPGGVLPNSTTTSFFDPLLEVTAL